MVDNRELLTVLRRAQDAEEKAMPIYSKHLQSAIFWTGISPDRVRKAKEILKRLARESAAHKVMVDRMIKKLEQGEW